MGETLEIPAWIHWFIGRGHPSRAAAIWLLLDRRAKDYGAPEQKDHLFERANAVRIAAEALRITPTMVRYILRQGEGTFWRVKGRHLWVLCEPNLWFKIHTRSRVQQHAKLSIPRAALAGPLGELRAWLAQGAMTRGSRTPVSRAYTGLYIHRSVSTVTVYRRHLRRAGRIHCSPQYRQEYAGRPARPTPGLYYSQFKNQTYRRLPDIVVLINPAGQIDYLARNDHYEPPTRGPELPPRRYFFSEMDYVNWEQKDKKLDHDQGVILAPDGQTWAKIFTPYSEERIREKRSTLEVPIFTSSSSLDNSPLSNDGKFSPPGALPAGPPERIIGVAATEAASVA